MYPPMTSESSAGDSSSESSAGLSRKRCRSPTATVTSSIYAMIALVPSCADLLSPSKRFRDSISPEDSVKEDIDTDVLEDIETDATAIKIAVDRDVEARVDAGINIEVDVGDDVEDEVKDEVESSERGTIEVGVDVVVGIDISDAMLMLDRIEDIEIGQRELELRSLIAGGERASLLEQNMTITRSGISSEAIEELVNRRVEEALAAYKATRAANALEAENQSQNGSDGDNRNGVDGNGGDGKGGDGDGRNENPNENNRDARPVARECTYQDFMKCQPLNFKGTEGVLRLQDAVRIANNLMDQKLKGYAVKNAENKRRLENVARAYTAGNNERKPYNRPLPLYNKCKLHHEGPCTVRYGKCNKVGHLSRDSKVTNSTTSTQRGQVMNQRVVTCFACGRQGHYRSDCPKLKDQNRGNKARNKNGVGEARGKAYVLGGGDVNPDSNVIKGMFLLNNHYASMIFHSGADRGFVSTTFSALLDIIPDTLDVSYVVELADERISETNTVLRGYTLGLLGYPFNIELIPVELGSFYVIIGMDWFANHHAVIVCDEKIIRIPYGDEVLIIQGDKSDKGKKS
ncbi:reverse transcriptase domain-containing protein [Tanacetum coccineum]